jgi:hypothetical protein
MKIAEIEVAKKFKMKRKVERSSQARCVHQMLTHLQLPNQLLAEKA